MVAVVKKEAKAPQRPSKAKSTPKGKAVKSKIKDDPLGTPSIKDWLIKSQQKNDDGEKSDIGVVVAEKAESKASPKKSPKKDKENLLVEAVTGSDGRVTYQCAHCDKQFPSKAKLFHHAKTHNAAEIECNLCDTKFKNSANLKLHMKVHLRIKEFECDICGTRFTQSTHLTVHKRTHTNERPYKCDFCPKAFTVSNALTVHRRIHTGEKPYKCDECDKAFTESGKLTIHKRTHSRDKPFTCDVCDAAFNQPGNLTSHIKRYHTLEGQEKKFECALCGKQFADKAYLKTHVKYHTGEKKHACEQCPKKFTTKSELTTHMDYHLGIKKFKCEICEKQFFQAPHLKHHMKMHASGKEQCKQCKRFFGKDSTFEHKCLPPARFLGKKTKKNIAKHAKLTGRAATAPEIDDEITQSGLIDQQDDSQDQDPNHILEVVKVVKKKGRKKTTPKTISLGKSDGMSMVTLANLDIKEEVSDYEEEETDNIEFVLVDADNKAQKNIDVRDEMEDDDPEKLEEYIFGTSEEIMLMLPEGTSAIASNHDDIAVSDAVTVMDDDAITFVQRQDAVTLVEQNAVTLVEHDFSNF